MKNVDTKADLKYIFSKLSEFKSTLFLVAISGFFFAGGKALIAHFIKSLMDSTSSPEHIKDLVWFGIGLAVVISVSRYIHIFFMNMVSEKVTQNIRFDLQQKFLKLNLKFHSNYASGSGGLISRTLHDVKIVQDGLRLFADLFTAPVLFIAVLYNLFYFDKQLAFSVLLATPVLIVFLKQLSRGIKKYSIFGVEQLEKITSIIKESLDGVRTIQSFNLEKFFSNKLKIEGDNYIQMGRKVHSRVEIIGPINEFLATLILVGISYYFSVKIAAGQSTFGILMAYITTILQASEPIKKFQEAFVRIQEGRVCLDRIQKMISEDSEVSQIANPQPFPINWKTITFKNVTFSYESNKPLLQNFNLEIKRGDAMAFVGESGSGKTTVVNLLSRFYDPIDGQILIDHLDIKNLSLADLRQNIALVSQDVFLFSDSIESNISSGSDPIDHKKVQESSNAAFADEFISKQREGYLAPVGERGNLFSGGEKQRLAIARAFYKDAPILVLDKATSALDSLSEQKVQQGLEKLMAGRTTFIVAHRLSTIKNADQILVFKSGKIVEKGTHQTLLEYQGEYSRLYSTQNQH